MNLERHEIPPVVLLLFNRPAYTQSLLNQLGKVRPELLLVVADGPREDKPDDRSLCEEVRTLIDERLDWHPKVLKNYAPSNLGLRARVSSGLDWVFQQVDRAIILEDDCVPHADFFRFCSELLSRFEGDQRVGAITGSCFQPPDFDCPASYYFSRFAHPWGWATWRRAWKHYDQQMPDWPRLKESGWLREMFPELRYADLWERHFDRVYERRMQSWAFVWTYSCWTQNMIAAVPRVNLVENVGFGETATHTVSSESRFAGRKASALEFPLAHPEKVFPDLAADGFFMRHYLRPGKLRKLAGKWWSTFEKRQADRQLNALNRYRQ